MIESARRRSSVWLGVLLILASVRGIIYLAVIPPWQGPDETGHFEYAWLVAHLGRLPARNDVSPAFERELLGSLYEWRYGEYIGRPLPTVMPARMSDLPAEILARRSRTVLEERFSLSYGWQALFLLPVRFQDLAVQLRVARLSSVLTNVAIVWLAFRIFSLLTTERASLAYAMTAALVFLPQHTFINSMVGDGPLAELMACLVLYCWLRLFRDSIKAWMVAGIILGTVAAVWTKAAAGFLVPLNLGLTVWRLCRVPRSAWRWKHVAYLSAGAALLGISAWALFWSPFRLGPDRLGGIWESMSTGGWVWVDPRGLTLGQALLLAHDSFWANFGWMVLPVSLRWYGALLLSLVAAVLGWLLPGRVRDRSASWSTILMVVAFLTALAIFADIALLRPPSGYYQYQGRYLFPVTVPFVFLLVGGWERLVTQGRRTTLAWSGVAFLVLFDAWSILRYIWPYFHSK